MSLHSASFMLPTERNLCNRIIISIRRGNSVYMFCTKRMDSGERWQTQTDDVSPPPTVVKLHNDFVHGTVAPDRRSRNVIWQIGSARRDRKSTISEHQHAHRSGKYANERPPVEQLITATSKTCVIIKCSSVLL